MNSLEPAPLGNRRAERHGFYSAVLTPLEHAEVDEIAEVLRELTPVAADAIEPLLQLVAGQVWRRKRAYRDLEENGVVRARGKPAPILRDLETLERSILEGLKALAITPQSAASLGLTLAKTRETEREFDLERLTDTERRQLAELLQKAEGE